MIVWTKEISEEVSDLGRAAAKRSSDGKVIIFSTTLIGLLDIIEEQALELSKIADRRR